jgi:hypothetical protein
MSGGPIGDVMLVDLALRGGGGEAVGARPTPEIDPLLGRV